MLGRAALALLVLLAALAACTTTAARPDVPSLSPGTSLTPQDRAPMAPTLSVRGNRLVDGSGHVVQLTGVNRSGTEYACAERHAIFDGPTDTDAAVAAIASWHANAVRIPLNEDCWLGINGLPPQVSGARYQSAVADYVTRLERFGLTPIINLHFSAPGGTIPEHATPMADEQHSPAFWHSVASYFARDHHLIFDLYNEPNPDDNINSAVAWWCIRDGGNCPGVSFPVAGMQQLVSVVRKAGATQPLMIAGPQYAGDLDQWLPYEPTDPLQQLVAAIHIYLPQSTPCDNRTCWDAQIAPVAAQVPVVAGEIGSKNCSSRSIEPLLRWLDANGVSYLAWAWNVADCADEPSLITSYSGDPTNSYGLAFRGHLAARFASLKAHRLPAPHDLAHVLHDDPGWCATGFRRGHEPVEELAEHAVLDRAVRGHAPREVGGPGMADLVEVER